MVRDEGRGGAVVDPALLWTRRKRETFRSAHTGVILVLSPFVVLLLFFTGHLVSLCRAPPTHTHTHTHVSRASACRTQRRSLSCGKASSLLLLHTGHPHRPSRRKGGTANASTEGTTRDTPSGFPSDTTHESPRCHLAHERFGFQVRCRSYCLRSPNTYSLSLSLTLFCFGCLQLKRAYSAREPQMEELSAWPQRSSVSLPSPVPSQPTQTALCMSPPLPPSPFLSRIPP